MTLKLTTRIREVLCPIFLCLLLAISTSTHANDVKTSNDVSSIFVYLKQIKNDVDYLTKIDTLIENIDENTPTEVMIEIDLIKIKALSKFANPREASDFAHEIYQKYQREDYSSEKQYGRVMVEIVKSSAKRLDFSLSLEIVQQMREITYQTPSSYLEFVIDRCLMEIYIESFDYERALEVELKMLSDPIYESEKSFISWKPSLYNEIAFIYNRIGNGEEALKYLTSAKAAYELARDKQKLEGSRLVRAVAINKGNRARAYLLTENYTEAERLGRDVLEAGISLKQAYIIALGHRLIGSANYNAGHYEKARIALAKGIQSADENNIGTMQLTLYKEYALTLEALGHHEEALNWQKKQFSVEIETQRLAASAREALNGAEARALKRYQELMTLKQVNETQREISNRDDKIKKLLAVVAIVFACFSYSAFSNRRRLLRQAERMKDVNTKLKTATLHDPLTGLPNRSYIKAHLDKELAVAKEQNKNISAIHIDLDHFKEANDSYGHAAGDHILIEIAKRMKISCDADKVVARIGGDEFLMVATNVIDQASIKADMEAMLKHIMTPLNYEGITIHSSASIGITCEPAQNCDSSDLIVNSDLALYEAKQDGRGCIRIFEPHMRDALNRRKLLEAELKRALDVEKIQTYFQPQINISTNKVIGIEALVRWNHETRGFIPPQEFLPIAESSGHMVRLGRHPVWTPWN